MAGRGDEQRPQVGAEAAGSGVRHAKETPEQHSKGTRLRVQQRRQMWTQKQNPLACRSAETSLRGWRARCGAWGTEPRRFSTTLNDLQKPSRQDLKVRPDHRTPASTPNTDTNRPKGKGSADSIKRRWGGRQPQSPAGQRV